MDDWSMKPLLVVLLSLVVSLAMWMVYREGIKAGRDEVTVEWQADRIAQARANAAAQLRAREREQTLRETVDHLRGEYGQKIQRITVERDALVRELRRRPERPADYVPPAAAVAGTEPAASCSGDQLYRDDGEFLAGLAASADTVRASLMECRAAYDAARESTHNRQTDTRVIP